MKDSVEENQCSGSHYGNVFECVQCGHCTDDSKSVKCENKCLDHHNSAHWNDEDISCSLESPPVKDVGTQPIQCTEDQLQRDIDADCSFSEHHQDSVVQFFDDDIDLPHFISERKLWEHSIYYNLTPKLKCVTDSNSGEFVDEKELRLKYTLEENTDKKLSLSSQDESEDSTPLEIGRYLKRCPTSLNYSQVLAVYMLPSFSTQISTPVLIKQSQDESSSQEKNLLEMNRLATYTEYPGDLSVFAITLAGDGFIYLPSEQSVKCVFCQLHISLSELYKPGVKPVNLHLDRSPQCPLKQELSCGNVPVPQIDEIGAMENSLGIINNSSKTETSIDPTSGMTNGYHGNNGKGSVDHRHQAQDPAVVDQSSRVIHNFLEHGSTTDSVPFSQQDQLPNPPPRINIADTVLQQSKLPSNASASRNTNTVSSQLQTDCAATPANKDGSTSAESADSKTKSLPSGSRQNATSSSTASSQPKNTKFSKKTKSAKKAEASNRKTSGTAAVTAPASSGQNSVNKSNSFSGDKVEPNKDKKKLTFADLGIYADKAKRADMGSLQKRLGTFEGKWKISFAKTPQELADCGMYYAGYADCGRCFFCGGGLKNWEAPDEPWVEHARWFPKCAYVRLCKGPVFVDIVQRKNKNNEKIKMKDVEEEIQQKIRSTDSMASAASLPVAVSVSESSIREKSRSLPDSSKLVETLSKLEEEHEELTTQVTCKICMDEKSSVVFLPCGHMVACTNCAVMLKVCPFCRADIKGTVKAHLG